MKIRFLFPKNTFNSHRIDLVRRISPLSLKEVKDVKRVLAHMNEDVASFYEGFLESEDDQESITARLKVVAERLSDNPYFVKQHAIGLMDFPTYLIEEGDGCEEGTFCC